jgi:heme exporter protein D
MTWASWSDFVAMGGYGLYVWGSFAVTALVIAGEIWSVAARRRALSGAAYRDHDGTLEEPAHEA